MSNDEWGVPDWRDASAYPKPDEISDRLWRWEFIRRMPDYRQAWDRASKIEYETHCRQAEKAQRDKSNIMLPDNPYFVVNTAAFDNPNDFRDLMKYGVNQFYNPRVAVPRWFRGGPSVMHLPVPRYVDERGGYHPSQPKLEYTCDPVGIRAGWTIVHFDLMEPLDAQLNRAKKRLKQVQKDFLEAVDADPAQQTNFAERLKQKTDRRQRRDMWPLYLRVLDARNTGASYEVIGRKLKGIDDGDISQMSRHGADKLLSQIENARIDAKKWHHAALKVANNWTP